MPRGGKRSGTPGQAYTNRTDLNQPVRAAKGQTYGERGAQEQAQQAVPLPQVSPPPLTAPTQRPNEPVTAGSPTGPGPGPEVLGGMNVNAADDDVRAALAAIYRIKPTSDLARVIGRLA